METSIAAVDAPAVSHDAPALNLVLLVVAGLFLSLLGFIIPGAEYDLAYVPVILALYVTGLVILRVTGGRALAPILLDAYIKAILAVSIVLVLGCWWALQYGDYSPAYLIDRFKPTGDDNRIFEHFILPVIGDSSVSLLDGETNAPLHWWAIVRLENVFVDLGGRPFPLGANLLNVCIGSMTTAYSVGACHLALLRRRPDLTQLVSRMVRYCPWLLAASALAIREIWAHCVFAAVIFFGFRARELAGGRRWLLLVVVMPAAAMAMYLLRPDMLPILLPLGPLCAWAPVGQPRPSKLSRQARLGLVAAVVLLIGGLLMLPPVQELIVNEVQQRALKYIEFTANEQGTDDSNQNTLVGLFGDNIVLRGVIESAWIWEQPLPKVVIKPGSLYVLGRQLLPVWLLALLYGVLPLIRRRHEMRQWWQTWRWLLVAVVATTILVGFTSGEGRHVFSMIPVICVLFAGVLASAQPDDPALVRVPATAVHAALVILGVSALFTLAIFGPSVLFPSS